MSGTIYVLTKTIKIDGEETVTNYPTNYATTASDASEILRNAADFYKRVYRDTRIIALEDDFLYLRYLDDSNRLIDQTVWVNKVHAHSIV